MKLKLSEYFLLLVTYSMIIAYSPLVRSGEISDEQCKVEYLLHKHSDLKRSVKDFDQTEGQGWRRLNDLGCHREAADLIQDYLGEKKVPQLLFHRGQMLAFAGQTRDAVSAFSDSLYSETVDTRGFLWNDYVSGVIAFLNMDYSRFRLALKALRAGDQKKNEKNIQVLRRLQYRFDSEYKTALLSAAPSPEWDDNCTAASDATIGRLMGNRIVIFGEIHGTQEIPEFVRALTCQLARAGRSVVLALEMPESTQADIDLYLQSNGSSSARDELLQKRFWSSALPFGVSSQGMFDVIEEISVNPARYSGVKVLAYDPPPAFVTPDAKFDAMAIARKRDEGMASAIRKSLAANSEAIHIVVTGRVHASKMGGSSRDPTYRPLASIIASEFSALAFAVAHDAGDAWVCVAVCGVTKFDGSNKQKMSRGIHFFDAGAQPGFDGVFSVGKISSSLPQRLRSFPKTKQ